MRKKEKDSLHGAQESPTLRSHVSMDPIHDFLKIMKSMLKPRLFQLMKVYNPKRTSYLTHPRVFLLGPRVLVETRKLELWTKSTYSCRLTGWLIMSGKGWYPKALTRSERAPQTDDSSKIIFGYLFLFRHVFLFRARSLSLSLTLTLFLSLSVFRNRWRKTLVVLQTGSNAIPNFWNSSNSDNLSPLFAEIPNFIVRRDTQRQQ